MIRRDYIVRMIEEFVQALARIRSLRRGLQTQEAWEALDAEFQRLLSAGAPALARLSETELLAKLLEGEQVQLVRHKTCMVTTLFSEAGDLAAAQGRPEESREYYLKALHLLLDVLGRGEVSEIPEFVPKIEALAAALRGAALPLTTQARLMQHYERAGEFGKAEDFLFAMLEADPGNPAIRDFGLAFYRRLLSQSDTALAEGNLPRPEIEEAVAELQKRG